MSSGHRNPQGVALDGEERLWLVEHGVRGGDELNLIRQGSKYGWPLETYGTRYNGAPIPTAISTGKHEAFLKPILAWLPSVAPSDLLAVEGFHPGWDGDFLITTLRGRKLIRIRIEGERVVFAEDIPMDRRMRNIEQMRDGRIVLWTDNQEVIFLRPVEGSHAARFVEG